VNTTSGDWLPRHRLDGIAQAAWSHLIERGGGLVVVCGPVGVGKTTTARRLVNRWVVGATSPALEPPLGLWTRLATMVRHDGVATPEILHRASHHELADAARHEAVTELLTQLAAHSQPEVLFDDLHSADAASLTALAQVAPSLATMGVRMVATSRGADAHPVPLARRAHRIVERHATSVGVEPLTPEELLAWLHLLVPGEATPVVADAMHRATGGTPLAVVQLMTWARRDPRPLHDVLGELDRSPLRPSQQLWSPVIGDVHPRAQLVLAVIAELGDRTHAGLLASTVSVTPEVIAEDVAALMAHGLVHNSGSDSFRVAHPSIAEAITTRGPWLTHEHHRRVADSLANSHDPADAEPLRRHLSAAGALTSPGELLAAAHRAAQISTALGDTASAARAWAQVVDLDDAPQHLLACARAHRRAGSRLQARRYALRAHTAGDPSPVELAEAALLAADGSEFHGDAWSSVAMLERALTTLERSSDPEARRLHVQVLGLLAQLEMTLPLDGPTPRLADLAHPSVSPGAPVMWQWLTRPERAQPRANKAEELAATLDDAELQATAGLRWRTVHHDPAHHAGRLQRSTTARAVLRDPLDRADAVRAHALDALEGGDRTTVDAAMAEVVGLSHLADDTSLAWRLTHTRAMLARADGDITEAERLSEDAFALGRLADEPTAVVVRAEQWAVHATDRLAHVDQVLAAGTDYAALRHPPVLAGALALCAELAAAGYSQAHTDPTVVRQLVEHLHTTASREQNWMITAAFTARTVWLMSLTDLAEPLLRLLEPWTDRVARESSGVVCDGHVLRHVATLTCLLGDDATSPLTQAIARDRAAGFERSARCGEIDLLTIRAVTEAWPSSEVRAAAEHLMAQCSNHGLACLAAQAGRLGRRLPHEPLTERQQRILDLLAQGTTYQQIADAIGFSHGTVRAEVTRLYAALGSDRRDEALVEARWRGLLDSATIG
jgi:DNA-binding CsgD family transcriptional regulator